MPVGPQPLEPLHLGRLDAVAMLAVSLPLAKILEAGPQGGTAPKEGGSGRTGEGREGVFAR